MSKYDNAKNFKPHEVFISYRRKYGWQLAMLLSEMLEARGISAFYDQKVLPKQAGDIDWPDAIKYNLEHCEVFVMVISDKTLFYCGGEKDPHSLDWPDTDNMWDELEYVVKHNEKCKPEEEIKIVPIIANGFLIPEARQPRQGETEVDVGIWGKTPEQKTKYKGYFDKYIGKRENVWVEAKDGYNNLLMYINKIKEHIEKKHPAKEGSYDNAAYSHKEGMEKLDQAEAERLERQTNHRIFDLKGAINEKIAKIDELYVLDVGCAEGYQTYRLLSEIPSTKYVLGLDNSKAYINNAIEKYSRKTDGQEFEFEVCDITKPEFEETLKKACKKTGHKFNFVIISLVLMHISTPQSVITTVAKYMEPGGLILVADVDDSLCLSYSTSRFAKQDNEIIDRYNQIYANTADSGFRYIGRRIYGMLHKDFEEIDVKFSYYSRCGGAASAKSVSAELDDTLMYVENQLKDESMRISDWVKFKNDSEWLINNKENIIQIRTDEKYYYKVVDLIFTGIRKE